MHANPTDFVELSSDQIDAVSGGIIPVIAIAAIVVTLAVATFPDFFTGLGDGLTDGYKGK